MPTITELAQKAAALSTHTSSSRVVRAGSPEGQAQAVEALKQAPRRSAHHSPHRYGRAVPSQTKEASWLAKIFVKP